MIKLKNNTDRDQIWFDETIPPDGEVEITRSDEMEKELSRELREAIFEDEIIVNDGAMDLAPKDGWKYLKTGSYEYDSTEEVNTTMEAIAEARDLGDDFRHHERRLNKVEDKVSLLENPGKEDDSTDKRISQIENKLSDLIDSSKEKSSNDNEKRIDKLESKLNDYISDKKSDYNENSKELDRLENKIEKLTGLYKELLKENKQLISSRDRLYNVFSATTTDLEHGTLGAQIKDPLDFEQGEVNEYFLNGDPGESKLWVEIKLYLDDVLSEEVLIKWTDINQVFMKIEVDGGLGAAEAAGDNSDTLLSWKFKDFTTQIVKLDMNFIGMNEVLSLFKSKSHEDCKGVCASLGKGALELKDITFNEVNYN